MDMRQFLKPKFLKVEDCRHPHQRQIVSVELGQFGKPDLVFEDGDKLGLSATNIRILSDAFGSESDRWPGRIIELYVGPGKYEGENVDMVLVKIAKADEPSIGSAKPATKSAGGMDDEFRFEDTRGRCANAAAALLPERPNMICFPTAYAGANFRSRLEARWAAFFDLAGWRWEYEPPEEIGWVPDFLLIGDDCTVKVEVKPLEWIGDDPEQVAQQAAAAPELAKVRAYVSRRYPPLDDDEHEYDDVLVVGCYPHFLDPARQDSYFNAILGVFLCEQWGQHPDIAHLAGGYPPRRLDFHAAAGSFGYRMGGERDSAHHLREADSETIKRMWREAGNTVQWRP